MDKKYPEPIAGAFIINSEGKLFLMKSHKWNDMWVIPGGHIEFGETIEKALAREILEETNITIKNPRLICVWDFIQGEEFIRKTHMIFLNYRVDAVSTDVSLNSEGQEYMWVSKAEALALPLNKETRQTIEQFGEKVFSS